MEMTVIFFLLFVQFFVIVVVVVAAVSCYILLLSLVPSVFIIYTCWFSYRSWARSFLFVHLFFLAHVIYMLVSWRPFSFVFSLYTYISMTHAGRAVDNGRNNPRPRDPAGRNHAAAASAAANLATAKVRISVGFFQEQRPWIPRGFARAAKAYRRRTGWGRGRGAAGRGGGI